MILGTSISESVLSWRATPESIKESLFIHSTNTGEKMLLLYLNEKSFRHFLLDSVPRLKSTKSGALLSQRDPRVTRCMAESTVLKIRREWEAGMWAPGRQMRQDLPGKGTLAESSLTALSIKQAKKQEGKGWKEA